MGGVSDGVGGFQRRENSLGLTEEFEGAANIIVGGVVVLDPTQVAVISMLRPDGGIIKTRRNRVRRLDLPIGVLQNVSATTLKHPDPTALEARCVLPSFQGPASGFDADQANTGIRQKIKEEADGIAAPTHAGHHLIRQAALKGQNLAA